MEEARKILLHPNFNQLSPEQIQNAYQLILASGISKEQIATILKERNTQYSYLENLPYDVFLKTIDAGEIKDKDLINLCNSSPILNNYCDRDYLIKNQQTDQIVKIIPQYVFSRILEKAKIRVLPKEIPKRVYIREFIGGRVKKFNENKDLSGLKGIKFILPYKDTYYILKADGRLFEGDRELMKGVKNIKRRSESLDIDVGDGNIHRYGLKTKILGFEPYKNENNISKYKETHESTIRLTFDGKILVSGWSKCGNLGLGPQIRKTKPTNLSDLPFIVDFDYNGQVTALVDIDGHVWLFGNTHLPGFTTELPDNKGMSPCQWTPKMVPELENIVQISVGYRVYLALYANGNVRFFGDPTIENESITIFYGLVKKEDGSLFDDIIKVFVYHELCFILSNKGELYIFGYDAYGYFGEYDTLEPTLIATQVLNFFYYGQDNLFLIY